MIALEHADLGYAADLLETKGIWSSLYGYPTSMQSCFDYQAPSLDLARETGYIDGLFDVFLVRFEDPFCID